MFEGATLPLRVQGGMASGKGTTSHYSYLPPSPSPTVQGGIASGKSTVARHLREALGATCLDCDQLAHEVRMHAYAHARL